MAGGLTISTLNDSSGVLATQNGMSGIAKAWVSYNGVSQSIRGSFNVSSVTRNATGSYTVNFTTSMPDTNYAVATTARRPVTNSDMLSQIRFDLPYSTTQVGVYTATATGYAATDCDIVNVTINR